MIDIPPPPLVVVQSASDHQPTFFLGFMAVGNEKAMSVLEEAARKSGFPAGRTQNDKNQTEVMVLFPAGSDSRSAISLYHDALSGKFGSLTLEVTIAPGSAALDGKLDMDKEVSVEMPNSIIAPKP